MQGKWLASIFKTGWFSLFLPLAFSVHAQCQLTFSSGIKIYPVTLAHMPEQQKQGLSGRLDVSHGMLFVWSTADYRQFWMRDTYEPLELYFLDEQAVMVDRYVMSPLSDQIYMSQQPVRYALELPLATLHDEMLHLGDHLIAVECD